MHCRDAVNGGLPLADVLFPAVLKVVSRFYMVTGEKGWFPYGTDCSGEGAREAYCVKVS